MLSSVLFFQVNQRLNETFENSGEEPFAGLPVIVYGDFYQLPAVKGSPIYSSVTSIKDFLPLDMWKKFQMEELTEVMQQRGDYEFLRVLNKSREGIICEGVERTLKLRFLDKTSYPKYVVLMFAENKPVKSIMKLI